VVVSTRRELLAAGALAAASGFPAVLRAQQPLAIGFRTIPDPDGWHPSLRLKGDWLVVEIDDGRLSGFGEASHSRDDARCRTVAAALFAEHYADFPLSLETLAAKEAEIAALAPDFVTATAFSALNQAFYDLLAKREQVPVWQLFRSGPGLDDGLALYTTINRALKTRTRDEYSQIVGEVAGQGFSAFKCAPFEAVDSADNAIEKSAAGLGMLGMLRERFGDLAIRVDFHERFRPADFFGLLPALERLALDWIEEPFAMGDDYTALRSRTDLRIAGGELFWGRRRFEEITDNGWVDVIMPDVKHVGGFGPLLDVLRMGRGRVGVSPHNPSGPISTAASLHAAVLHPETVRWLEYAFDRAGTRRATGERVENGRLYLSESPGWGVEPPGSV
jgi:galactonate dehydratase